LTEKRGRFLKIIIGANYTLAMRVCYIRAMLPGVSETKRRALLISAALIWGLFPAFLFYLLFLQLTFVPISFPPPPLTWMGWTGD
jgi:hypothetical protein